MQCLTWVPPWQIALYVAPRQMVTLQAPQLIGLVCWAAGLRTGSCALADGDGQADTPVMEAGSMTEASGPGSGAALARDAIRSGTTNSSQRNDFIGFSLRGTGLGIETLHLKGAGGWKRSASSQSCQNRFGARSDVVYRWQMDEWLP